MAQHTVNIPILESAFVDSLNPTSNYGDLPYLRAGGEDPDPYQYNRYTLLIKYPAYNVPSSKKRISSYIKLYSTKSVNLGSDDLLTHENLDPSEWNESTVTHSSIPKYPGWRTGIANLVQNTYYSFHAGYTGGTLAVLGSGGSGVAEFTSHRAASNKPYLEIVYEDIIPGKPNLLSPVGVFRDNVELIRFEWKFVPGFIDRQVKVDIQWSIDQQNWNTITVETENEYYDVPPSTFPAGNIYWRARTYNEYGEVGEYSDISVFYCTGAPLAPSITSISQNTARPIIEWSSSQQQVYELQVLQEENIVYDSGNVPTAIEKAHKIKTFLDDGIYTARIRVKNEYDMWSQWTEQEFSITTTKPGIPTFILTTTGTGIDINIQAVPSVAYYLIYRDGVCIGKTEGLSFSDNTGVSEHEYFIRAVTENEAFQDSLIKLGKVKLRYSYIAPVSELQNVFILKYGLNKRPTRNSNRNLIGATIYYSGRKHSVTEYSEHIESGMSFEFLLKTYAELERFIAIYDRKEPVLYRDNRGRKIYGNLNGLFVREERPGYIITFTLTETDYAEGVDP